MCRWGHTRTSTIPKPRTPPPKKKVHEPREERESRFVGTVSKTVKKGGRCLIPVFALGRAQELLLVLDEYWQVRMPLQGRVEE